MTDLSRAAQPGAAPVNRLAAPCVASVVRPAEGPARRRAGHVFGARLAPPKTHVYLLRVRVRWVLLVTIFLAFAADAGAPYEQMFAPLAWAHVLLFEALPYKIRGVDHVTAICLIIAAKSQDGRGPRVAPVRGALLLSAATTVIWFLYGIATSGGAWEASWQTYLMMSGVLLAFAVAAAFRTPEHFTLIWKAILWAAAYRAMMCVLFYIFYIHTMRLNPPPEFLTSHDDTVLWVVAMMILVLRMIRDAWLRVPRQVPRPSSSSSAWRCSSTSVVSRG